jgi:hypothetical protein
MADILKLRLLLLKALVQPRSQALNIKPKPPRVAPPAKETPGLSG